MTQTTTNTDKQALIKDIDSLLKKIYENAIQSSEDAIFKQSMRALVELEKLKQAIANNKA